jgi:hypothetical protein
MCQCLKVCWACVSWASTSSFNKLLDLKSVMLVNYNYLSKIHIRETFPFTALREVYY